MPCLGISVIILMFYCSSSVTGLLQTAMRLLNDCSRFYPHADHNMAENLMVRREVAVDSVRPLLDSLDSGVQVNAC